MPRCVDGGGRRGHSGVDEAAAAAFGRVPDVPFRPALGAVFEHDASDAYGAPRFGLAAVPCRRRRGHRQGGRCPRQEHAVGRHRILRRSENLGDPQRHRADIFSRAGPGGLEAATARHRHGVAAPRVGGGYASAGAGLLAGLPGPAADPLLEQLCVPIPCQGSRDVAFGRLPAEARSVDAGAVEARAEHLGAQRVPRAVARAAVHAGAEAQAVAHHGPGHVRQLLFLPPHLALRRARGVPRGPRHHRRRVRRGGSGQPRMGGRADIQRRRERPLAGAWGHFRSRCGDRRLPVLDEPRVGRAARPGVLVALQVRRGPWHRRVLAVVATRWRFRHLRHSDHLPALEAVPPGGAHFSALGLLDRRAQ
mmetsp:Transcript_79281/g.242591  ORF Transcript_79281/g.242591 Transcript_79281/m.242591 type:complete len:364 (+) Transcript_79281:764-1855(+)